MVDYGSTGDLLNNYSVHESQDTDELPLSKEFDGKIGSSEGKPLFLKVPPLDTVSTIYDGTCLEVARGSAETVCR